MAVAASSRLDSSTMSCSFSFQPELLTSREQTDCFANALLPRFRTLGYMDPNHKVTPMRRRQLLKEIPRFRIFLQSFGDVGRQVRNYRPRRIFVAGRRRRETRGVEQAGRLELRPALTIDVRPLAGGLSRRELEGVPVVIETLDQAVDPSEAQRLANRVLVRNGLCQRVLLMEHEPDPRTRRMVLSQPG